MLDEMRQRCSVAADQAPLVGATKTDDVAQLELQLKRQLAGTGIIVRRRSHFSKLYQRRRRVDAPLVVGVVLNGLQVRERVSNAGNNRFMQSVE